MVPRNSKSFFIKNTLNFNDRGWIKATDTSSLSTIYLCENTHLIMVNGEKYIFKVLSGLHKNKIVKISPNYFGELTVKEKDRNLSPAKMYVKDNFLFFLNTKIKLVQPIKLPKGYYNLLYPDKPINTIPQNYFYSKNGSKFASTWFPISQTENIGLIYLHLGTYSEGCLTVDYNYKSNLNGWDNLYFYLINSSLNKNILGNIQIK